ncbi:MAG: TolC family protein [Bacteroidota bacterium]|nr:TolC family protein [Bacteroidota bacterium]
MKQIWLIIFLFWGSSTLFAQQEPAKLSLNQLIDSALQNNYLLQANKKNTLIKQAEIEILKTNYQPKISASASFSFWKFLLPNKERLLGNTLTDFYTDVTFYQTVYNWGENKARKSVVEDEIKVNDEILRQIRHTIIWGVSDAFFEALKAKSEIAAIENALQQLQSQLQYAENLYKISKVSGVDLLKIKVQISVEEKNLQKAKNKFQSQLILIKRLCYLDEDESIVIEDIAGMLYTQTQNRAFSAGELYGAVQSNHPELAAIAQNINIEAKQKDILDLQSRPKSFRMELPVGRMVTFLLATTSTIISVWVYGILCLIGAVAALKRK